VPAFRTTLKPAINALGETVRRDVSDTFISKRSSDPVWALLANNGLGISVPGRSTKLGDRNMTDDELYTYTRDSGQMMRQWLSQPGQVDRLQAAIDQSREGMRHMSDEQKAAMRLEYGTEAIQKTLDTVMGGIRDSVKSRIRMEAARNGTLLGPKP